MNKIYPSRVAPVIGCTTNSYKESCFRFIEMSRTIPVPDVEIDSLYKVIGRIAEERVNLQLIAEHGVKAVERETALTYSVTPDWLISGRVDFIVGGVEVWEVKATVSKTKYKTIFQGGQVDPKNLGQLITYMAILEFPTSVLSYNYLHFDTDYNLCIPQRNFRIAIDGDVIYIDGVRYDKHSVSDFLRFYHLVVQGAEDPGLPPQSLNGYACKSCPFNMVCSTNPTSRKEFHSQANLLGLSIDGFVPKPKIELLRRK